VTNVCVLITALDALQNDFRSIIVSDASACFKPELHEMTLESYKYLPLDPLFRIMTAAEVAGELTADAG
jgi:isochorismate hydrolase